jgi:predicted phosphodiesterase
MNAASVVADTHIDRRHVPARSYTSSDGISLAVLGGD